MTPPRNSHSKIALIGLGPHAKRIYYPLLEKYAAELSLVCLVELESKRAETDAFLRGVEIQPREIVYLDDTLPTATDVSANSPHPQASTALNRLHEAGEMDAVIISSAPETHAAYLEWGIHANLRILMDKPVGARPHPANDEVQANYIYDDFLRLRDALRTSHARVYVQCQRRNHRGYAYIRDLLQSFIDEFQCPISSLSVNHADGMWVMPHEWERDHHPYKYGWGKLLHSGYHFVDLLAWLTDCNEPARHIRADALDFHTMSSSARDSLELLPDEKYRDWFGNAPGNRTSPEGTSLENHGERDVFFQGRLMEGDLVRTNLSLALQQDSLSARSSSAPPRDPYKGNGRIRHENMNLHASSLLNIQVHSYQSHDTQQTVEMEYGPGHLDHFDIYVFRNAALIGGQPFEKIEVGREVRRQSGEGHNEAARRVTFEQFLRGEPSETLLEKQERTNLLLASIYRSIARGRAGKNSTMRIPWRPGHS